MNITKDSHVSAVATEMPATIRILQEHGIDFCCGGKRTLDEACAQRGVNVSDVVDALAALDAVSGSDVPNEAWAADELTRYIVRKHHEYVRTQIPVIAARLAKLSHVHGARHPELPVVAEHFTEVARELLQHLEKEERILFPYIRSLVCAVEQGAAAPPNMFGTVMNPIRMMESEHQSAGNELELVRKLTKDFRIPDDACATYRVCFAELEAFDRDLRTHIHLENNILFPKAVLLEGLMTEGIRRDQA